MNKKRNTIIFFTILAFSLGFCKDSQPYWTPSGNFPLLNSQGKIDSSKTFNLDQVPKDKKIIFMNFFAPHCPPCVQEVPDIKTIYQSVKDKQEIQFVAIGSKLTALSEEKVDDVNEAATDIFEFIRSFKLPYQVYVAKTDDLHNFGLTGFPETFVLERMDNGKWRVKRKFVGVINVRSVMPYLHE